MVADCLGGLGGLLEKFQQSGHGDVVNSWFGSGKNEPIPPCPLSSALGPAIIMTLAQKTGLSEQEVKAQLSQASTRFRRQANAAGTPSNA